MPDMLGNSIYSLVAHFVTDDLFPRVHLLLLQSFVIYIYAF